MFEVLGVMGRDCPLFLRGVNQGLRDRGRGAHVPPLMAFQPLTMSLIAFENDGKLFGKYNLP